VVQHEERKPALVEDIDATVRSSFLEVSGRTGVEIVEMQTAFDHVHLLLYTRPGQALPRIMHDLKGTSARLVFERYPELRLDMGSNSFWQKSYGARRVAPDQTLSGATSELSPNGRCATSRR